MATKKVVVVGSTVSASQLKDFFRQIEDGSINGGVMQAILEHRDPWCVPAEFLVTSDGRTGEQFIAEFEAMNCKVGEEAKQLLRSDKFVATNNKTYRLGIIFSSEFEDSDRTNENIRAESVHRGWIKPTMEHACLLRKLLSSREIEQMGVHSLVVMHEPMVVSDDDPPCVLSISRIGEDPRLDVSLCRPNITYNWTNAFVFLVPQE